MNGMKVSPFAAFVPAWASVARWANSAKAILVAMTEQRAQEDLMTGTY
jgi:hypothetical protein